MKHLFVIAGVLSIVFIFGSQLVSADPFTLCVKDRNGKMKRGALGNAPAKGECKNPNKWTEVTLATEENVLNVESQLQLLQEELDALKDGGISSLIGGSHGAEGPFADPGVEIRYVPMFTTGLSETESEVTSILAAAGHITRLAVVINEPHGGNSLLYKVTINGTPKPLQPGPGPIAGVCALSPGATTCETQGCLKVNVGDTLSLHMQFTHGEGATIPAGRWTARFVETDDDCPLLE